MLQGVILCPEKPDELFITSLHTIRRVKWTVVVPTYDGRISGTFHEKYFRSSNMILVLDTDFTTFNFLSGIVRKGCHLFLPEKLKMTAEERGKLIQLAEEGNTIIQIRNDLLFHPSISAAGKRSHESKLVEIHHIAPDRQNSLQEMMYSNLLMMLRIVDSEPARMNVCSIPGTGLQPDVVNLQFHFHNGSAASITLSFTGDKTEHLLSVHSSNGVKTYNFKEEGTYPPEFNPVFENKQLFSNNLLFKQIENIIDCILQKDRQKFGLSEESGTFQLIEKINRKLELILV